MENKQKWTTVILVGCDKSLNNFLCVLKWHIGSDRSDIPEMKEAWLKQFSNMQIEMQKELK